MQTLNYHQNANMFVNQDGNYSTVTTCSTKWQAARSFHCHFICAVGYCSIMNLTTFIAE